MNVKKRAIFSLSLVLSLCLRSALAASGPSARPDSWATPVAGTAVENLYRVEADLYRSAQPSSAGFKQLAALGVKTVLDIAGGDGDTQAAQGTSIKLVHVPMTAFGLRDDRVFEALRLLSDLRNRPLLIHCRHGADRTGAIVALYRVIVQGWSKQDAIREMNEGGYHHNSFFNNLDSYVRSADVAALRKQLVIATPVVSLAGQTGSGNLDTVAAASEPGRSTGTSEPTPTVEPGGSAPVINVTRATAKGSEQP